MKVLKWILITIVGIIALVLIVALFVKKEYAVERGIVINKPQAVVFDYVKYLKNQDNYSVWAKMDPAMKREYRGTDGTVGFVAAWDSENKHVGKGEQEITGIVEGEKIDYQLRFFEPMESQDHTYFTLANEGENSTKIIWGFDGKINYPMNLMLLFMDMEKMLAPDLEQGLTNLKEIVEKQEQPEEALTVE
ncbi:MAG TPA: SRPBCC family protein [Lentimicrobium sp.]|nr:SRPBCC family protein [Lentimicrobium sp.]